MKTVRFDRTMTVRTLSAMALAVALALGACGGREPRNLVQSDVVDKSVFTGSWYMGRAVIDVDYEATSSLFPTFPGDMAYDWAENFFNLPRIRWVIDEHYLYAFRDYEFVRGGNVGGQDPEYVGDPVAAFHITSHFDIRRSYNSTTGEENNVVIENATDRRWWERQFMHVDWSESMVDNFLMVLGEAYALTPYFNRESIPLYAREGQTDIPASWRPQFVRMGCSGETDTSPSCTSTDRLFADQYDAGQIYFMSFVNQQVYSPGMVPDPFTGEMIPFCLSPYTNSPLCTSGVVTTRTSFLRVSDRRQYEPVNWIDTRDDRFGYFRLDSPTYDGSVQGFDDPSYGFTDFKNYSAMRHNLWRNWRDAAGNPIPLANREVRKIIYHLTPNFPRHLIGPSMDVAAEWSVTFMDTVRAARGQPTGDLQTCQSADPGGYCYCGNPADGSCIDADGDDACDSPTRRCPQNLLVPPAERAGVTNAFDCWVGLRDSATGAIEPIPANFDPVDPQSDDDYAAWTRAEFTGSECVLEARVNSCDRDPNLPCEERGDLRFKFISYVTMPGTQFLGVATLRGDPVTGEIIAGDANIGGAALDNYRTFALEQYDLVTGRIDERDLATGENVRGYFENLGNLDRPASPLVDFTVAEPVGVAEQAATSMMRRAFDRANDLGLRSPSAAGIANTFQDRLYTLAGTDFERQLLDNSETLAVSGIESLPDGATVSDHLLNQVSPFRVDFNQQFRTLEADEGRLMRMAVELPNSFVDYSVQKFVNDHAGTWSRSRVAFEVNRLLYTSTMLHELGHCLGLRHNMMGSSDWQNYLDPYYQIDSTIRMPDPAAFAGADGVLDATEQIAYSTARQDARRTRELAGAKMWMNSSIMEYTNAWYERLQPLGKYDRAAIFFGYGDLAEVYDTSATAGTIDPVLTPRVPRRYYSGGETCEATRICPFGSGGAREGELAADQPRQRCVANPRNPALGVCSDFYGDVAASAATTGRPSVDYRYCTDQLVGVRPGCMTFDEGANFREIVENARDLYHRSYLWWNFRRYRRSVLSSYGGRVWRVYTNLVNVYQSLYHRFATEPGFATDTSPFGFYDQYGASVDAMNFFVEVLTQPQVGSYNYNDRTGAYERYDSRVITGANLQVPLGFGKFDYSVYQRGVTGINRIERVGVIYDKLWALQALTNRDWGKPYGWDEYYFVNFYDMFPDEMYQVFNGFIRQQPIEYMPRVRCMSPTAGSMACGDPRLMYMNFWRGDCRYRTSGTCLPPPTETYAGFPIVDGGASFFVRFLGTIYALAQFPVYYDTRFQQQLFVCLEGSGGCQELTAGLRENVDYATFADDRFLRTFVALQVAPREGDLGGGSIAFAMVREANVLQDTLRSEEACVAAIDAGDSSCLGRLGFATQTDLLVDRDRVRARLLDFQSFFTWLLSIEGQFGISSWFLG